MNASNSLLLIVLVGFLVFGGGVVVTLVVRESRKASINGLEVEARPVLGELEQRMWDALMNFFSGEMAGTFRVLAKVSVNSILVSSSDWFAEDVADFVICDGRAGRFEPLVVVLASSSKKSRNEGLLIKALRDAGLQVVQWRDVPDRRDLAVLQDVLSLAFVAQRSRAGAGFVQVQAA